MYENITGIILAGGKSSRMGRSKALMEIEGRSVIGRMHALIAPIFRRVLVIANEPDSYRFLDAPVFPDLFVGAGPVAGIHSGLTHATTERNFVIACDLLLMTEMLIRSIAGYRTPRPITIASANGFAHHLCGIYEKRCLPLAESMLQEWREGESSSAVSANACSAGRLCRAAGAELIEAEKLPGYSPDCFFNMNRSEDVHYVADALRCAGQSRAHNAPAGPDEASAHQRPFKY